MKHYPIGFAIMLILVLMLCGCSHPDDTPTAPTEDLTAIVENTVALWSASEDKNVRLRADITASPFFTESRDCRIAVCGGAASVYGAVSCGVTEYNLSAFYTDASAYFRIDGCQVSAEYDKEAFLNLFLPSVAPTQCAFQQAVPVRDSDGNLSFTLPDQADEAYYRIPQGTTLLSAGGSGTVDGDGQLKELEYSVTLHTGNMDVTYRIIADILYDPTAIQFKPTDKAQYPTVSDPVAYLRYQVALARFSAVESVSASGYASFYCPAGGISQKQETSTVVTSFAGNPCAKASTTMTVTDHYFQDAVTQYSQREQLLLGMHRVTGGLPEPIMIGSQREDYIRAMSSPLPLITQVVDIQVSESRDRIVCFLTVNNDAEASIQQYASTSLYQDSSLLTNVFDTWQTNTLSWRVLLNRETLLPEYAGYDYSSTQSVSNLAYAFTASTRFHYKYF